MSKIGPQNRKSTTKAAMAKISAQMNSLKAERQTLHRQIDKIEERLSVLRAEYGAIYNAPSPLLNLPAEITCLIFDYAATPPPEYGYDRLFPPSGDDEVPLRRRAEVDISHVCKRWRDISLHYPRLWSRYFHWEDRDLLCDDVLQRLATYLDRSSTQSLELYLSFSEDPIIPRAKHAGEPDYRVKMLDMILANIERWKIVTIRAELDQRVVHWLRRLAHASAPKLEYFSFCPEPPPLRIGTSTATEEEEFDSSESASLQCTTFKGGAPKLSYIHLGGSSNILPPLSNVTTLRIELEVCEDFILSWPAMLQVFQIPTLVNLSIVGNVFHPPLSFEGLPLITMNNLEHFRYDNDHMTLLLPYLRVPSLSSLALRNIWMPEEFGTTVPFPTPKPDTGYFFPSLKSLTLIDSTASTMMAAGYFMRLTRNASTVLLSVEEPDENILNTLPPYTLGRCWPNLSTLILNLSADDEIELVLELVANDPSRRNQSVRVWLCGVLEKIWRESEPGQFMRLQSECGVDTVPLEKDMPDGEVLRMVSPVWPPSSGGVHPVYPPYSNNEDPFEILIYVLE